jgi:hypothetical protein
MVKVTVSVGSSRPGGIDILLAGLTAQTFTDFEVVFTDARYHSRHARVLDAVKASGLQQPFYHVPNARNNPPWNTSCAGVNTGFMLSAGEVVIMLLDYAYCPPGWIEAHVKHHTGKRRAVMSPHLYHTLPPVVTKDGRTPLTFTPEDATIENVLAQRENFDEVSIFPTPFTPAMLAQTEQMMPPHQDPKMLQPEGPSEYWFMHTKNESFLREDVLAIGGIEENYDRGGGPGDLLFGWQLWQTGCELWLCQEARVNVLNPRRILPNMMLVGRTREGVAAPGKWSYNEGEAYYRARMASLDPKSKNPYDMRAKREELWVWRDLSQQQEPVIPFIVKSDQEYFGLK